MRVLLGLALIIGLSGCYKTGKNVIDQTANGIVRGKLYYTDKITEKVVDEGTDIKISIKPVSSVHVLPSGTVDHQSGSTYEFGPLPPGKYVLETSYSDMDNQLTYYAKKNVTVLFSTHVLVEDIQLQWKPSHRALVRVTDHRGHPVPNAKVFLYRSKNLRNRAVGKKAGDFDMASVEKAVTNYNGNSYFEELDSSKLYFVAAFREVDGIIRSGQEELVTYSDSTTVARPDTAILLKI